MEEAISTNAGMPARYEKVFERFKTDDEFHAACESAKSLAGAALGTAGKERFLRPLASMPISSINRYILYAKVLQQQAPEEREQLVLRFAQMLAGLCSNNPDLMSEKWILSLVEIDSKHPLAYSLMDAADSVYQSRQGMNEVGAEEAAKWAARAVCLWSRTEYADLTAKSWMLVEHFLFQLGQDQNSAKIALGILTPIEEVLTIMEPQDAYRACRLKGILLKESEEFDDAVKAFEASFAFGDNRPLSTVDSREQMAWCLAATGKPAEAMKLQELALQAWEGQPFTERLAYNHGQITRHLCRLSSFEVAWNYVTSHPSTNPDDSKVMLEQLADAIWDAWREKGEAAAFQLGKRIFLALGNHGLEVQVGIWFKMVDAGLPPALLRELISEASGIFAPAPHQVGFFEMLGTWLDYLDAKPKDRPQMLGQFEPDWAQTIQSYSQNLSARTRQRYQLADMHESA